MYISQVSVAAAATVEPHPHEEAIIFLRGKSGAGFVSHAGKALRRCADGALVKASDYDAGPLAAVLPLTAHDAPSYFAAVEWAASQGNLYWVRGRLTADGHEFHRQCGYVRRTKYVKANKKLPGAHQQDPACFEEFARRGHMIDVDSGVLSELQAAGVDIYRDPDGAARLVASFLPDWVRRGPLCWSLSGSSGTKGAHDARFHFFFWTDLPISAVHLKAILAAHNETRPDIRNKHDKPALLDLSVLHAVQPHYLAAPLVYDEASNLVADPLPKRWGRIAGELPYSPLPLVDLFAGGSAEAKPARVQQRVTDHTTVKTPSGETATLRDLSKRAALPKSSAGCERLIGDGPGLRGFHEPTRDAIFWRLVEMIEGGAEHPLAAVEPYLGHLQQLMDAAPKQGRDAFTLATRRDINELRRMAAEGLGRAQTVAANRKARREARVVPLFPDSEVPLTDAQVDLEQFLGAFFADARAHHGYHQGVRERAKCWGEHHGAHETRGLLGHLRINTRFIGPPVYIAAHETGLAKSSTAQRHIAKLDLSKWRVFYFAPNHAACEQVRADLKKLGVDAFVLKGIDFKDDAAGPICAADQRIKTFAEQAKLAQASQRETACVICPLRNQCAYLAQADEMRRPGVKILPHAFLQSSIPGLSGEDAATIFCAVLDEKFTGALKVELTTNWGERQKGSTNADRWARDFLHRLADTPAKWGLQDHALKKLAELASCAAKEYNDARSAARDDLRADLREHGIDAQFDSGALAKRQHLKFIAGMAQLVADQIDLKRNVLQGVSAWWATTKDGERPLHAQITYRGLLPDFGCPILALDATHDDRLTSAIFAQRRYVDRGDDGYLAEPALPLVTPKYRRVRVRKPHEHIIAVPDAPTSKTALGTDALKPAAHERVPAKLRKAGAAIRKRPDGKLDVYPARSRADSSFERVARALRWFSEGASHDARDRAAGIFGHKEQREFMEAHGMFGENVRPGHHGIGTALNDWQDVERFAVVGVTRLDEAQLAKEVEAFFALAPTSDVPRLTSGVRQAGLRLRDGRGYPVHRTTWDDERVDALVRQIGEAQLEQELGRARSVWRTAANAVVVLVMANAVIDRTFDAVLGWDQLERLTPFDVAASAGVVPTKATELHKLLPGLFSSPRAAKDEINDLRKATTAKQKMPLGTCAKNDARGYIENLYLGAGAVFGAGSLAPLAGNLPAFLLPQLTEHEVVLKRANRHVDRVRVLVANAAACRRYATALGKKLVSATPLPATQASAVALAAATAPKPAAGAPARWNALAAMVRKGPWEWPDENRAPWPDLPLAPGFS